VNPPADIAPVSGAAPLTGWRAGLRNAENSVVVLALALMAMLPCAEIALRKLFNSGVPGSVPVVQHLVLVVSMLGGAIAARDNRLLALSSLTTFFKPDFRRLATMFSHGFAAGLCALLTAVAFEFVIASRKLGKPLVFDVPVWIVQSLLVLGFAAIALRLIWHAGKTWRGRLVALALAATVVAIGFWSPIAPEKLRWIAIAVLVVAALLGAPVFTTLGGATLILFWSGGETAASLPTNHYRLTINPMLPTLPLFTLAGYFLAEGGAAKRLVRVFQALFRNFRGGPAIVTALVCAFFTSFTGASGVTILALGGVLMPVLLAAGYRERSALGLLTGAGSLGMLFPPCLPPILYAIIASSGGQTSVTIEQMFKGGFLPGVVLVAVTIWWGVRQCPPRSEAQPADSRKVREGDEETGLPSQPSPPSRDTSGTQPRPFDWREALAAAWAAKWEFLVPVVALTALFGGFASPVEAAAITALYTFAVNVFITRDLRLFKDVPRVMAECGLLMGGVLLILGVALGFTHYLIDAQIPDQAVAWATGAIKSKWLFLLGLNVVLLVVGGMVEIYAAIVVVVPLLVPLGAAFGIDPIHLGIIFLANMELGFLAPPVGLNLLLASYRFNKPMPEVTRASFPMLLVMVAGVLLITYVPWLTTWLPGIWK
jgi:C4-dicarboxylate transporter DctM subunit